MTPDLTAVIEELSAAFGDDEDGLNYAMAEDFAPFIAPLKATWREQARREGVAQTAAGIHHDLDSALGQYEVDRGKSYAGSRFVKAVTAVADDALQQWREQSASVWPDKFEGAS